MPTESSPYSAALGSSGAGASAVPSSLVAAAEESAVGAAVGSASDEVQRVWRGRKLAGKLENLDELCGSYQVVTEELHNKRGVLVALLAEGVKLCIHPISMRRDPWDIDKLTGNGIVEGLLGEMASLVGGVENLIVEHGKVQSKAQADGVSRRQLGLGDLGSSLVRLEGLVSGVLASVSNGELGEVTVIVALPMVFIRNGQSEKELVQSAGGNFTSCGRRP
jgi:hypothetical protein